VGKPDDPLPLLGHGPRPQQEDLLSNQLAPDMQGASLRINYKAWNETLESELAAVAWFNKGDTAIRPKVTYAFTDELTWEEFAVNWETDVKMTFSFCREALRLPLAPGATVIVISSGAALGGSPISGGYAGAKRTQMFIANYAQKESDRLRLGVRFFALAPACIMPDTELGRFAVESYARYLGISPVEFVHGMSSRQTPEDVANATAEVATHFTDCSGSAFTISGEGLTPAG